MVILIRMHSLTRGMMQSQARCLACPKKLVMATNTIIREPVRKGNGRARWAKRKGRKEERGKLGTC